MGVQYIFIEIQKIYTIIQHGYIHNTSYTIKNNIVAIRISIHNYCHAPKMSNDKEEAVQLICLLEDIMNRQ